jgi:hypothetical protein
VVRQPQHYPTGMRSSFAAELYKKYIKYRDEKGRVTVVLRVCGECSVLVRIEPVSHYHTPHLHTLSNLTPFDLTLHHYIPPYPSSLHPNPHPTSAHLHHTHFQLQERYLALRTKILACAPSDPSGDFPTQLSKLAAGVLTARYAQPEDHRCYTYTFSLSVCHSVSVYFSVFAYVYRYVCIYLSIPPSLFFFVVPLSSSLSRPVNHLVASISATYIIIFPTLFVTFSRLHPTLLLSTVLLW